MELHLEIVPSDTGQILAGLENKEIDCGFVFGEHHVNGFEMKPLARADVAVAVPILYKKTHGNTQWEDMAKLPWIVPTNLCPFVTSVTDILAAENLTP
jgi:DNA-binding transcriptional LysR family regulator